MPRRGNTVGKELSVSEREHLYMYEYAQREREKGGMQVRYVP